MACEQLTPAELVQLQQLMYWMQSDIVPTSSAQPPVYPHPPYPQPGLSTELVLPPPLPASVLITHSYQSLCTQAPLGLHTDSNTHTVPCSTLAPEPFLGFSNLGTSMTGQVNQWRLTSSVATQPRQPQLPSCGSHCRRGPAIQPISFPPRSHCAIWCPYTSGAYALFPHRARTTGAYATGAYASPPHRTHATDTYASPHIGFTLPAPTHRRLHITPALGLRYWHL